MSHFGAGLLCARTLGAERSVEFPPSPLKCTSSLYSKFPLPKDVLPPFLRCVPMRPDLRRLLIVCRVASCSAIPSHSLERDENMAAAPEVPRLPGDGPPDPSLLAENNGPMMLAVVWPLFSVAGLFIGVRFYAKYWRGRKPWWDDYALVGAWVCPSVDLSGTSKV